MMSAGGGAAPLDSNNAKEGLGMDARHRVRWIAGTLVTVCAVAGPWTANAQPPPQAPGTRLNTNPDAGLLRERGNCQVYELEDIATQIRH
jgi:hypothetical protein